MMKKHFDEAKHKRGPKGSPLGGKFVKKDGQTTKSENVEKPKKPAKSLKSLVLKWMRSETGLTLTDENIEDMKPYRLDEPTVVYRGMRSRFDSEKTDFTIGEELSIGDVSNYESFTTSRTTAEQFMISNGTLPFLSDQGLRAYYTGMPAYVTSHTIQPEDSIFDFDKWAAAYEAEGGNFDDFPMFNESEIIAFNPPKAAIVTLLNDNGISRK
jgi:hypothetical protein